MRRKRGLFNCRVEGRMRLTTLPGLTAIILALSGGGLAKPKQPISVHLNAADVVYSPVTDRLFASVVSGANRYPSSIAVIDPHDGSVVKSIQVDGNPGTMALSDDGRYLYVALDGLRVIRINALKNRSDIEFQINPWPVLNPCPNPSLGRIQVMPGHPETVAVPILCNDYALTNGVALFDNGIMRPRVTPWAQGIFALAFESADTIWADSSNNLYKITVSEDGLTVAADYPSTPGNGDIVVSNGLLYTTNGKVIDPNNLVSKGRFYTHQTVLASAFAIDPLAGRAYFSAREGYGYSFSS